MELTLTPIEVRVLGCLIEKEATTPAAYPLSLNALKLACNQKTSREPVMNLDDAAVQDAVDTLIRKTLVAQRSVSGSRVPKYAHRLRDRLNPPFSFAPDELAIMGMLFLRGPQTRGELRTRCVRLHDFPDTAAVEAVLQKLRTREDGPYVTRLPVAPGHKEARFAHLASGEVVHETAVSVAQAEMTPGEPLVDRIAALEHELSALRHDVEQMRAAITDLQRR